MRDRLSADGVNPPPGETHPTRAHRPRGSTCSARSGRSRAAVGGHRGPVPRHDTTLDTHDEGDTVDHLWDLPSKRDLNK
jgi:hypothetical protein